MNTVAVQAIDVQISNQLSSVETFNCYRQKHPHNSFYHDPAWAEVICSCFGHDTYWVTAYRAGSLAGILPLVFIRSRIFGRALVSMPYFNYGGILADDSTVVEQLLGGALELKGRLRADYVELRQIEKLTCHWPVRSHKVNMLLPLAPDLDMIWKDFKSKLRSQIRRPQKEGCAFSWGRTELLPEFYSVFSENMRDLGTPVYPRRFFATILRTFPEHTHLAVVRLGGRVVAAGFLIHFREKMEIPWASSLADFNSASPNMLLYWGVLQQAVSLGMKQFDFGRSTLDSGTYRFKEQWGAQPSPSYWIYPGQEDGDLPDHSPQGRKYYWATRVWRKLPLFAANRCGPWIVRGIP